MELRDFVFNLIGIKKGRSCLSGKWLLQKEEDFLREKSAEYASKIEDRLLNAYRRIRSSVVNRLAIVPVERGASGGSFFTIPPQVQMEIAARKKIITDEHSGRILVDAALAEEERENAIFVLFY